jgi:protein O-mannosyl-transferase
MAKKTAAAPNVPVLSLLLFLLVLGAFLPALMNGFVNFDDPLYVVKNVHVNQGLTWAGLGWAFHNTDGGIWLPLTWFSHMLDCQLYGLKAWGHHLTSVLIHAVNAVLVLLWLRRMTGATWRSFVVATLFGLHPLRVESVAWVAERKDVLSGLFWFLTLLAYTRFVEEAKVQGPRSKVFYALTLFSFACGLMAKPMLVTLPFVLLLLDWWPLNRLPDKKISGLILEKLPFFVLSAMAGAVTFAIQKHDQALVSLTRLSPLGRIENTIVSYARYLGKTFWPDNLSFFYPYPGYWPSGTVLAAAILLAVISLVVAWQWRRQPYLLVGWLWFLGTLVPVIGLVQVGEQAMADRYTYIPQVGLLLCLVWSAHALTRTWKQQSLVLTTTAGGAIIACTVLTHRQIGFWKNSETLFQHAIAVTDKNVIAHINLGVALDDAGHSDEAIEQFHFALRDNPASALAYNGLGLALSHLGRMKESGNALQTALAINPNYASAYFNLGNDFFNSGRMNDAFTNYQKAVEINPGLADADYEIGNIYFYRGQLNEAITNYQKALAIHPGLAEAQDNLGNVLLKLGRVEEAIAHYQTALAINPGNFHVHNNLGTALLRTGRLEEAMTQYRRALEIEPANADACFNLGLVLFRLGRADEAITVTERALQLAKAQNNAGLVEAIQKRIKLYRIGSPVQNHGPTNSPAPSTKP